MPCAMAVATGSPDWARVKVGPEREPTAPLAGQSIDDPAGTIACPRPPNWSKLFNDPTLDALIEAAYHDNLSLQSPPRASYGAARLNVARGELFPQQQVLGAQVQRRRPEPSHPDRPGH